MKLAEVASWSRSGRARWIALLLLACAPSVAAVPQGAPGLRPSVPFADYIHREYTAEDGLPSSWVHALHQTGDGYVWVGTHDGLARFDGLRFRVFRAVDTPALPSNNIRALYEDRDGVLWIGTSSGLVRYVAGRFEAIPELDGVAVGTVYQDAAGTLWVGGAEGAWSDRVGDPSRGPSESFFRAAGSPSVVHAFCEDSAGALWLGSHEGLFRLERAGFEAAGPPELAKDEQPNREVPRSAVWGLHNDDDGLWIATSIGLMRRSTGGQFAFETSGISRTRFHRVLRSRSGTLFVGGRDGLFRSVEGGFESLSAAESVACMLEDREGGLWLGHAGGRGLHRYQNPKVPALLTDRYVHCVLEDYHGAVWFGSNLGLSRLHAGKVTHFGVEDGIPGVPVRSIAQESSGGLWLGTAGGLALWDGQAIAAIEQPASLARTQLKAVFEDSSGILWIANRGVGAQVLWEGILRPVPALSRGRTHWFHEDVQGRIWVGHEDGLFRGDVSGLHQVVDPELERLRPNILCHYAAPNGDLWLGTITGLARFRSERFDVFTIRDGIGGEYIDRIQADALGNLWLGGRHGFCLVPLMDLDDFAAGRLEKLVSRPIDQDYGMSRLAGGAAQPKATLASDGTLWMGAARGVLRVPSNPLARNPIPPPVIIEEIRIGGDVIEEHDALVFASGPKRLLVRFTAPAFSTPERVRLRYRLDGYEDTWTVAGPERTAQYTDLRPGSYELRVVAENEDGVWNESGEKVSFRVVPLWWQRPLIRAFGLVGFVLATVGFFLYRTRRMRDWNAQLRKEISDHRRAEEKSHQHWEQLARVSRAASMGELTTSIAHEVGPPLLAITSNADTAKRLLGKKKLDHDEIRGALDDITNDSKRASEIIDHIRSMVRKDHGPLRQLDVNTVTREALELVDPEMRRRGLLVASDLQQDLPEVQGDPIELQQVIINLVLNAAQAMEEIEAGMTDLRVQTSSNNGSVHVAVRDRGVGLGGEQAERIFEPFYTTKANGTGMGLAMNRAIIERHGGRIWASDNPHGGVTVEFSLPVSNGEEDEPEES